MIYAAIALVRTVAVFYVGALLLWAILAVVLRYGSRILWPFAALMRWSERR